MKIKSRLFDEASGSIGNITAANGLGGLYFKDKPNPINPNTANQRVVRNALAAAVTAWGLLPLAIRQEWDEYGKTCSHTNQTGYKVVLNGWNAFSRAFVGMTQAGISTATIITGRPANDGYHAQPILALSTDGGDGLLTVQNTSGVENQVIVYVGKTTRATINNYGGSFNYDVDGVLADDATLKTTKETANGRNWVRSQAVTNDGQMSRGVIQFLDQ